MDQLKAALPAYLDLGREDRAPSCIRQGEQVWEQQLRNFINHRLKPGNPIKEGLVSFMDGHIALTPAGRDQITRQVLAGRQP
ncbi:hypothetical protein [Sphingosinicella rhizophila]|uniref:Uncharacterized protein n=1 Tax=Sphingosinicella rhizophila TaxID=3050082 RepID=A0ABU3QBV1_9SPHN|nr:hypothetical protein [Sphingosinicella sp. GR2756]MDT9600854.1 hypothetical protein [Sphingosinicella sp. GR2756]